MIGQPQLWSSIGSFELSEEQCPETLTLTCDARNFGTSNTINWFVDNEQVAAFDINEDSAPFTTTTTRPDILNATVRLMMVNIIGGQFHFLNFSLSAKMSNFLPLQGHNISCGNTGRRSSQFRIKEFTVNNESTSYQGNAIICIVITIMFSGLLHIQYICIPHTFIPYSLVQEIIQGGRNFYSSLSPMYY